MSTEIELWPICILRDCGEEFPPARKALGYCTCLKHAHLDPLNRFPPLVLMDVNKSNPTITRSPQGFVAEGYAQRPVRSELRQTRAYVQLQSREHTTNE